ncbi:MAG: ABC transporter ATP-binding protein [Candidatus Limnocylindrales bacterium]
MGDQGSAIRVSGLVKAYGPVRAVDGLDLDVPQGVVFGFLGPNGAGKTTTMRVLTGLIRPDAGRVELFGQPLRWLDRKPLFAVGALIESPAFYPYLSGRDNLRVLTGVGAAPRPGRVATVLEQVDLVDRAGDRYETYSLGMKQRLGIAAALLNDPPLLLLDEPANGLDPAGIVAMRALLQGLAAAGKTVFVSSHILPEIQQMADEVAIIARGRLVRAGRLDQLLGDAGEVRIHVDPQAVARAAEVLGHLVPDVHPNGHGPGWLSMAAAPARAPELNRALVGAGVDVSGLEVGSDLEGLFLSLTEGV